MATHENSDGTSFIPGSIVKFTGLQAKPELNGHFGIVKQFLEDKGRYEILPSRGKRSLAIKPINLTYKSVVTPNDDGYREQKHQVAAFWPITQKSLPVQGFEDWPTDWTQEERYLQRKLGWKTPALLSGIESEGAAKPDFEMYFDADDHESPPNTVAQAIADLLPEYERFKVSSDLSQIRGVCILVYEPMITSFYSSGNPNRHFSLEQLHYILHFLTTQRAKAQSEAHDNYMHSVFGGMI